MTAPRYPAAPADGPVQDRHGLTVADPYRWLEPGHDGGRAWGAAQTALAAEVLDALPHRRLAADWLARLACREQRSVPTARPNGLFYLRTQPGEAQPALVLGDRGGSSERVLAAPTPHGDNAYLAAWQACPHGRWLAFQTCTRGAETDDLWCRDVDGAEPDRLLARGLRSPGVAWLSREGQVIGCYTGRASASDNLPRGLLYCPLGSPDPDSEARIVWSQRSDAATPCFVNPAVSPDGSWLLLTVRRGASAEQEAWLARIGDDPGRPLTGLRRIEGDQTLIRFGPDGYLYLAEPNLGGAVTRMDPGDPAHTRQVLLKTSPGQATRALAVARDWAAVVLRTTDSTEVVAVPADGGEPQRALLPDPHGSASWLSGDPSGPRFWFEYVSLADHRQVLAWEPARRSRPAPQFRSARPVADTVETTRRTCVSEDGTEVDFTLMRRAGQDSPAPCVVTAYGGFGRGAPLSYRPEVMLWVLSGGVYAVAHVRGGGERGPRWHAAGRGVNKVKAVEDLIAVAEHLLAQGTAREGAVAALGESNGGLVATAAAVRRPDLFAACVAYAPVTDLVRYPYSGEGRSWLPEYGDPDDPDVLPALLALSPYHNVRPGDRYPAFLLATGADDQRVTPSHARKLCAALQAGEPALDPRRPVLLVEKEGRGHRTGATGLRDDLAVDQTVFLWRTLGLSPRQAIHVLDLPIPEQPRKEPSGSRDAGAGHDGERG